ncbi:hypothetical protein EMPS_04369 [Entomortierella parvispora]|uniref:C2 domain-containing protein n=1 Tax=Entomortierella parvispora TaxID=205924 RepID=A0A9P3H8J5_9FUNG|nr:hypothetical protein EMPS_04369 [Entomortierella parvispora]
MMLGQQPQGPSLAITAHNASDLQNVETFGKQDPYFQFSLDITNPKSFQKSFVHKDAGKNPVWNQSFNIPLNREPELFVEIMDEEMTADAVIGFAAIPLTQVYNAPGATLYGNFDLYTTALKQVGTVTLTLTAHNLPGTAPGYGAPSSSPIRGESRINEIHQKRIKSLKSKEVATEVGAAALGGLFAVGAGLLANKLVQDGHKKEQARKEQEAEAQAERERLESEKKALEEQRSTYERTHSEEEAKLAREQEALRVQQKFNSSSEDQARIAREQEALRIQQKFNSSSREEHHEHHHHSKHHSSWNATGTYSVGEKVTYQGREFICLQGHTSNPTWEPTQAHSLWRAE